MTRRTLLKNLMVWAIVLVSLQSACARAEVILDNFSTPSTASSAFRSSVGTSSVDTSSIMGGTRTTTLDLASAISSPTAFATIGAGSLTLTSGSSTTASVTLAYSGLSLSLSSYANLVLNFESVSGIITPMPVSVTINGVTDLTSVGITANPTNLLVGLTSANFPTVNFGSINSITVTFNDGNQGGSFVLNGFGANPVTPVPEPASLALWGVVGLVGAWYGRRKMQRTVAL